MKFPEFFQTSFREVVVGFLRPVFAFRIVEPFDEVKNSFVISPAALDRGHNFFHIVFLRLFDVIRFAQHLRGVRGCSVFAGSVWFEQQHVEDVVDLPLPR